MYACFYKNLQNFNFPALRHLTFRYFKKKMLSRTSKLVSFGKENRFKLPYTVTYCIGNSAFFRGVEPILNAQFFMDPDLK